MLVPSVLLVILGALRVQAAVDNSTGCRHLTNMLEDLPHRIRTVSFDVSSESENIYVVKVECNQLSKGSSADWCWLLNDATCTCDMPETIRYNNTIQWHIDKANFLKYDGTVLGCFSGNTLKDAVYTSDLTNQPVPDKDKEVVIGVSITLGLVTTLLFIAPCFAISYWSSRQSARAKPGVPRTVRMGSRLSGIGFPTGRNIKEQNIERVTTLGRGKFGGSVYKAKVKEISPSDPKKVFACIKVFEGAFDRNLVQQQIDFRKNFRSHENLVNFLGCFIGKKMILAVELGWYGNLFSYLEEKKRAMYIADTKPWTKLGDYEEIHSKVARVDCEGSGLESIVASEDYRKAFLGPMNAPIPEDTMVVFGLQIASALDLIGKLGNVHKSLTCESVYISSNFGLKVGGFDCDVETDARLLVNELTDGPLLQKKTSSNRWLAKWSPPEVIERLQYSRGSDIWSFGMTLWELASYGTTPWDDVRLNVLTKHLLESNQPPCPSGCSETLYGIMKKCLTIDPNDRPGMNIITRDLKRLIRDDSETPAPSDRKRRSTLPTIDPILTTVKEEDDSGSIASQSS